MSAYCCVTTGILKNDLSGDTGSDAGACRARPGDTWVTIYVLNQSSKETFEFYLEPQILSNIRTLIARTTNQDYKAYKALDWPSAGWSDVMMMVITDLRLRSSRQLDDGDLRCVLASIAASIWSWTIRGRAPPLTFSRGRVLSANFMLDQNIYYRFVFIGKFMFQVKSEYML